MDALLSAELDKALPALAAFKKAFGRDASPFFIAELLAARQFELKLHEGSNEVGSDGVAADGKRYQIKHRNPGTQNVDLNNFEFDFIVLVNVDDNYTVTGMWKMDRDAAKKTFVHRPEYRKYQATQKAFKAAAQKAL